MDSAPDRIEPFVERTRPVASQTLGWPVPVPEPLGARPVAARQRLRGAALALRWPVLLYLASRALVLAVAAIDGYVGHRSLMHEFANWDGLWYTKLASDGYPAFASHLHTTLGFFPLYPMVVRRVAGALSWLGLPVAFPWLIDLAGVVVSGIGGLVSAVLVQRLAATWWGESAGRRAVAFFCFFPGAVVFSMVYAEGLLIPLAAGCILALGRRRWLLAGVLAGLATATEPQGLVLIIVCTVSATRHLRRTGRLSRHARTSLAAPLLSLTGVAAFASFLWVHTGTPLATVIAQRYAWHERFDPFALVHLVQRLAVRISHYDPRHSIYNPIGAVVGTLVLVALLIMLLARRRTVSVEALVWTVGISFIAVTSERLPPNSRMLITAFPALLVVGSFVKGWKFWLLQSVNAGLLAGTAWLTFVSHLLPP